MSSETVRRRIEYLERRGSSRFICAWEPDETVQGARLEDEVMERLTGEAADVFVKRVFDAWGSAGGFIEWV